MPNLSPGKGLGFKVGTQASVNNIILGQANAVPGSFYLAEDTHRLYIGNDDMTLSPVNEGVVTVASTDNLPTLNPGLNQALQGQFYYCTAQNILCVCSGDKWVQINPDTYLYATDANISTAATQETDQSTGTTITTVTVTDTIRDAGGQNVHTSSGQFSIKGSENVQVSLNTTNNTITLSSPSGAKYELIAATETANTSVKLTLHEIGSNPAVNHDIILNKGNGGVYPVLGADGKTVTLNGGGLTGSAEFTIEENNGEITLQIKDAGGNIKAVDFIPIIKIGDTDKPTAQRPEINFSLDSNNNLIADLPVYTKSEIDTILASELQDFEAMYFAGTIGSTGTTNGTYATLSLLNAATGLKSGATFKVISNISNSDKPAGMTIEGWDSNGAQVGDLIIVTGQEYQNTDSSNSTTYTTNTSLIGTLATKQFTYVPSGDDTNSYYKPNLSGSKQISFTKYTDGGAIPGGDTYTLTLAAGSDGDITLTDPNNDTENKLITIGHKVYTTGGATATPATAVTNVNASTVYNAVTGVTLSNGHVTGVTTTQITLTHNKLKKVETTAAGSNPTLTAQSTYYNTITVGQEYQETDSNNVERNVVEAGANNNGFALSSQTLSFAVANAGAATGTAGTSSAANINIEMIWGSF